MSKDDSDKIQAKFTKYLETALKNKRINFLRKKNSSGIFSSLDELEENQLDKIIFTLEENDGILNHLNLLDAIRDELLFNSLSKLKPIEYKILNLRLVENNTFYEISEILETDIEKTRNLYYNTIKKLKKILEEN